MQATISWFLVAESEYGRTIEDNWRSSQTGEDRTKVSPIKEDVKTGQDRSKASPIQTNMKLLTWNTPYLLEEKSTWSDAGCRKEYLTSSSELLTLSVSQGDVVWREEELNGGTWMSTRTR